MADMPALARILNQLELELDQRALGQLDILRTLLLDYNLHTNLTAIRDPLDVEVRLIADSLALLPSIRAEMLREGRQSMRLIDIGTGAGFPGMPLAIACQEIEVTLVDATKKKVTFIEEATGALGLPNAVPVHARSEELAHQPEHRERYDIVTARAVAPLPALVELCLPFLRVGGLALFTKGRDIAREVNSAKKALDTLGGEVSFIWDPPVSELDNTKIVHVRKTQPSPGKYPRSPGTPARTPL